MAPKRGGLGRGLDSLIPAKKDTVEAGNTKSSTDAPKKDQSEKTSSKNSKQKKQTVKADKIREEINEIKILQNTKPDIDENEPKQDEDTAKITETIRKTSTASALPEELQEGNVVSVKISKVEPNREQPRKAFDKEKLDELTESIREYGVIQPLIVQKKDDYYEIIAGERRWRASQAAGLKEVPVIIRNYSEQETVEISLIENIQREDLNPIEEANAYLRLMEEFHLTQDSIAKRVSKSRVAIANAVRLLKLPDKVREMLIAGDITEGHARAILGLPDSELQTEAARRIVTDGLSVRDTERLVKELINPPVKRTVEKNVQSDLIYRSLEDQLKGILGTKVAISRKSKNKGKIEIEYYSADELERILDLFRSINTGEE